MHVETLFGDILEISDDLNCLEKIKEEIFLKYGYPKNKQYIHETKRGYLMLQIDCGGEEPISNNSPSFSQKFVDYGCPPNLINYLHAQGYTEEDMYSFMLPGMVVKEQDHGNVSKENLDLLRFKPLVDFIVKKEEFDQDSFLNLVQSLENIEDIVNNEDIYCENIIKILLEEDYKA